MNNHGNQTKTDHMRLVSSRQKKKCQQLLFLQTTDTSKAEVCTRHGTSHSHYIVFFLCVFSHQEVVALLEATRLLKGRRQFESVGTFPNCLMMTKTGILSQTMMSPPHI